MLHPASALVWFRRDLRMTDHAALAAALSCNSKVWCVFIFDTDILDPLLAASRGADRRVEFIHQSLVELDAALRENGGGLIVQHGRAEELVVELARALGVESVYSNRDYEPAAIARDRSVQQALQKEGRQWFSFGDQVIFEKDRIMTAAGGYFSVFTPYKRAWLRALTPEDIAEQATRPHLDRLAPVPSALTRAIPSLTSLGFGETNLTALGIEGGMSGAARAFRSFLGRIDDYRERRDFPAVKGPSYLSVHLRFGTVSIRALARAAIQRIGEKSNPGAETWLSELIWRDFYAQILYHRPDVIGHAFKPEYDAIEWEQGAKADALFMAWANAETGYPLVDAAMHQINETGYMHNRLRMVTASFLVKDLGIDWRRGEAYFALHLNDFDLASNNGGWQWAASTGCDAQPYFRIFNPVTQSEKFDAEGKFIRRYLPVLSKIPADAIHCPWMIAPDQQERYGCVIGADYPAPVVDHAGARSATLERYQVVKSRK